MMAGRFNRTAGGWRGLFQRLIVEGRSPKPDIQRERGAHLGGVIVGDVSAVDGSGAVDARSATAAVGVHIRYVPPEPVDRVACPRAAEIISAALRRVAGSQARYSAGAWCGWRRPPRRRFSSGVPPRWGTASWGPTKMTPSPLKGRGWWACPSACGSQATRG